MSEASREADAPDLPDWELVFRFSSGRLCLSFCATVGERWRRTFERLREPADLSRWVVAAGLVSDRPRADEATWAEARALREAIYRSMKRGMTGRLPDDSDREILNDWARRMDLAPQIDADGVRRPWPGSEAMPACLASVARDAVDLLTSPELARVRECSADDCALLFLDRSRPGKRRWCADGACGSRARSASYRRRHRDAA